MSTKILDGIRVRDAKIAQLSEEYAKLGRQPILAIVQVGDRPDSNSYIKAKITFAKKIGVEVSHIKLPDTATRKEIVQEIEKCNQAERVQGIIVQLPLPISIDADEVMEAISPNKDVDALTSRNVKKWLQGREDALLPATTRGVKELLEYYNIDLFGKHVVIVGRSMLVGKPLAALCLNANASITICHSKTKNLSDKTKQADVLITAIGKPNFIGQEYLREGVVVIDVGINTLKGEKFEEEISKKKIVGDVDFEKVKDMTAAITPVPGGAGPMTVCALYENLLDLCKME